MAIEPREQLKTYFQTGDIPTEDQFDDVLDSYIHKTDDGVTIYKVEHTDQTYFGINTLAPQAPLGVTAFDDLGTIASFNLAGEDTALWFISLNPPETKGGFSIDQSTPSGNISRSYISPFTGFMGLNTTQPKQQLDVQGNSGGDVIAVRVLNTATVINQGFGLGHENNETDDTIDGSFSIFEDSFSQANKRLVIRAGGNVGINELSPDTKLHVSRDIADAATDLDLIAGTGIVTIGPMTNNIVMDYRGIQAREGEYVETEIDITAATLNLQRLGGDILLHGDDSIDEASQGIITADAKLGLGVLSPAERIDIDGAIKLGTTNTTNAGSIRYSGDDFEGYMDGEWVSFTKNNVNDLWTKVDDNAISYVGSTTTLVGIGTETPAFTLHVKDHNSLSVAVGGDDIAACINNSAVTAGKDYGTRIALVVETNNEWAADGYDIGIYVADMGGAKLSYKTIAAAFNGNVVIGNIAGDDFAMRQESKNVLTIRAGTPPSVLGSGFDTICIYANDNGPDDSIVFNVMNASGKVVRLYQTEGINEEDNSDIGDTYTTVEAAVMRNMRDRIGQLEARLQELGLLGDPVTP